MITKEEVIKKCTIENMVVKLPTEFGQLDRKLYMEVAKTLEVFGGKWKGGKIFGFVFDQDPTEILNKFNEGVSLSPSKKVNLKKEFQFFETPADLADELVKLADIKNENVVLEPSAGKGAIIDAILRKNPNLEYLFHCEKMCTNQIILQNKYKNNENVLDMHPFNDDFLELKGQCFDKIIANPPFSKNQDIDHVYKMYESLKPGGRLVSVVSKHWNQSNNKKETEFRNWLQKVNAKIIEIEAGRFKESGTNIATCILVINK